MTPVVERPADSPVTAEVVLVGYGRAGAIHGRAYRQMADMCRLVAVVESDPGRFGYINQNHPSAMVFGDLDSALVELGPEVILDFCVPARLHLDLSNRARSRGVHRFIIEKPLGWDVASTENLIGQLQGCDVVYLDTYASSQGMQRLLEAIGRQASRVARVKVAFHKNRIADSRARRGFHGDAVPSAWMIEGPHMISIARRIAGEVSQVVSAATFDMEVGDSRLPDHGGGQAVLQHVSGAVTQLELNLCSQRSERRITVMLENGVNLQLDLPPSGSKELVSVLETHEPPGEVSSCRVLDRPMESCVQNAIGFLLGQDRSASRLEDGLAVCRIVGRMTEKTRFWQSVPGQWKYFGPPLRPCREDLDVMERMVADWAVGESACDVLLCGVTPEISTMDWPAGTRLWAVERSRGMIEEVWSGRENPNQLALEAEWTRLPMPDASLDVVIGDGCFTSLQFPQRQREYLREIRRVLRPDGRLIMRFFAQPESPESPAEVFSALREGRIGSFHAFKWRLAMALQHSTEDGVPVDRVWQEWRRSGIVTAWAPEVVQTIDTYRGSEHCLTFATIQESLALTETLFDALERVVPGYELGERCPIIVFAPKRDGDDSGPTARD